MEKRPNFILITTDQQCADHLECYGTPVVRTPVMDSLAARGVVFDAFYVACPKCMPNRVAFLTGRMPTTNGTRHKGNPLSRDAVNVVDVRRAGGYHTGLVGKSHAPSVAEQCVSNADIFPSAKSGSPPHLRDAYKTPRIGSDNEAEPMPLWKRDPHRGDPPLPYYGYDFVRFAKGHSDYIPGHYNAWLPEWTDDPDSLRGPENALAAPGLVARAGLAPDAVAGHVGGATR